MSTSRSTQQVGDVESLWQLLYPAGIDAHKLAVSPQPARQHHRGLPIQGTPRAAHQGFQRVFHDHGDDRGGELF